MRNLLLVQSYQATWIVTLLIIAGLLSYIRIGGCCTPRGNRSKGFSYYRADGAPIYILGSSLLTSFHYFSPFAGRIVYELSHTLKLRAQEMSLDLVDDWQVIIVA